MLPHHRNSMLHVHHTLHRGTLRSSFRRWLLRLRLHTKHLCSHESLRYWLGCEKLYRADSQREIPPSNSDYVACLLDSCGGDSQPNAQKETCCGSDNSPSSVRIVNENFYDLTASGLQSVAPNLVKSYGCNSCEYHSSLLGWRSLVVYRGAVL